MRLKVIFGHPKWPPHFVKKKSKKWKLLIDLKWRVMRSKVIFGHPKWPPAAILWKKNKKNKSCVLIWNGEKCDGKWFSVIQNGRQMPFCENKSKEIKVVYWSEIVTNVIKSDFRSSKMAASGHFVKKNQKKEKLRIDLKWREMRLKVIFSDPKWPPEAILWTKKIKVGYWSEIVRNAIKSDFRSSKMAASGHFVKKIQKKKSCVLICNGEKCDQKWFLVLQNGRQRPFCEKKSKLGIDLK